MKMDAKSFFFIVAAVIIAGVITHFLIKEKTALDGKVHKGLLGTPTVPAATDPANANNPASPFATSGN